MKNKDKQDNEELLAADIISRFFKIPFNNFTKSESPDYLIDLNGHKIGLEIESINATLIYNSKKIECNEDQDDMPKKPSCLHKNMLDDKIKKYIVDKMVEYKMYNLAFNLSLDLSQTYFSGKKDNEIMPYIEPELDRMFETILKDEINQQQNPLPFKHIRGTGNLISEYDVTYYSDANWEDELSMVNTTGKNKGKRTIDIDRVNILITNGVIQSYLSFDEIKNLIDKKEKKISGYQKANPCEEYWLALFLPQEEHIFSIKGIHSPTDFKSGYSKIILAQHNPPFAYELTHS
jgi:hypothetical protein